MKNLIPLLRGASLVLAMMAASSCGNKFPSAVDYPHYSYRSYPMSEITRVERTDTATILTLKTFFDRYPAISTSPDDYLLAGGRKFTLIGTEGITPGEDLLSPESGVAEYKLIFEPIPSDAGEISFLEGDQPGDFQYYHIDLTGKKNYSLKNKSVPEAAAFPDPSMESGLTRIEIDLGCDLTGLPPVEGSVYNNSIFPSKQYKFPFKFDENGKAAVEFFQNGTSECFVKINGNSGPPSFITKPGETARIRLDGSQRYLTAQRFSLDENPARAIFEGAYSALWLQDKIFYDKKLHFNSLDGEFAKDASTGAEYMQVVKDSLKLKESVIESSSDMTPLQKEYAGLFLKGQVIEAVSLADYIKEVQYQIKNRTLDGYVPLSFSDEDYAWLGEIGLDDPKMMFIPEFSRASDRSIAKAVDPEAKGLVGQISKLVRIPGKISRGTELTEEEEGLIRSATIPMLTKGIERLKEEYAEAMARQNNSVMETPDVPADKVLDAILERYKGKAVLVDFWATWCGPCIEAMRIMEPLKDNRLKDVTFVYITSTTSPIADWRKMIPDIHGDHYYLTEEQLSTIYKQLKTNAFPSYLVVGKDGSRSDTFIGYQNEILSLLDDAQKGGN